MFNSIAQVHTEFFKQFAHLKIPFSDGVREVPYVYARKSSYDYAEANAQKYPCIAAQDYQPILHENGYIDVQQYTGGTSFDGLKTFLYKSPIQLTFRYDVSIASKSYTEHQAMNNFFFKRFVSGVSFMFNKQVIDGTEIGDPVPYKVEVNDIPREDGVFETNFEFEVTAWVHLNSPIEVDAIQQIAIEMIRGDEKSVEDCFSAGYWQNELAWRNHLVFENTD